MNYFKQPFSKVTWRQNYQYEDEPDWFATGNRVSEAIASVETNKLDAHVTRARTFELLRTKRWLPGGRVIANSGTDYRNATSINCFVSGTRTPNADSIEEINAELGRCMKILASEGGYGLNANWMRPRGTIIRGTGARTPGAVEMLNMWDQTAQTLTKGPEQEAERVDAKEKIRKGAMMVTMALWHPDVREFISAKQQEGRLTNFNMSVLASDDFMEAVKADEMWKFVFPAFEEQSDLYNEVWDGSLAKWKEAGGKVNVLDEMPARELWDMIMESTYNNNEPGVQFVDTVNRRNPLYYTEYILASNPCVSGDTEILTRGGHKRIDSLVGESVQVWNGHEWSDVVPKVTGENKQLLDVTLSNGVTLSCTPEHEFVLRTGNKVSAASLEEGDALAKKEMPVIQGEGTIPDPYTQGFYAGDGQSESQQAALLYGEKQSLKSRLATPSENDVLSGDREFVSFPTLDKPRFYVPKNKELETRLDWLAGLMDADGSVNRQTNSLSVQITTNREDFAQKIRLMLTGMGVRAKINLDNRTHSEMPDGNGGTKVYNTKPVYRVLINATDVKTLTDLGLNTNRLDLSGNNPNRDARRFVRVEKVQVADVADKVYCFTEDKRHLGTFNGIVTGQCGEQFLPRDGACNLGNFVLPRYGVRVGNSYRFDWQRFKQDIPTAVRALDNVNDLSAFPLEAQAKEAQAKRRIGLGHMGFGSLCLMLGIRYGSDKSVAFASNIQNVLANEAYRASALLAREKGSFPEYDEEKYVEGDMFKRLDGEVQDLIRDHGLRNSHLLSIQPTGNTSQIAGIVSGGLEPVFSFKQQRTAEYPHLPEEIRGPNDKYFSWNDMEAGDHVGSDAGPNPTLWKAEDQYRETVWRCVENGFEEWTVHPTRGICKDVQITDYGVLTLQEMGEWDPEADWAVKTSDLSVDDHLRVMEAFAEYTDSAMSKTVNVPNDYSYEDFKDLYMDAWETGLIKGLTTYRIGTMSAVLQDADGDEDTDEGVYPDDCPKCGSDDFEHSEGCKTCSNCGYEVCEL